MMKSIAVLHFPFLLVSQQMLWGWSRAGEPVAVYEETGFLLVQFASV